MIFQYKKYKFGFTLKESNIITQGVSTLTYIKPGFCNKEIIKTDGVFFNELNVEFIMNCGDILLMFGENCTFMLNLTIINYKELIKLAKEHIVGEYVSIFFNKTNCLPIENAIIIECNGNICHNNNLFISRLVE